MWQVVAYPFGYHKVDQSQSKPEQGELSLLPYSAREEFRSVVWHTTSGLWGWDWCLNFLEEKKCNLFWVSRDATKNKTEGQQEQRVPNPNEWFVRDIEIALDKDEGPPGPQNLPPEPLTIFSAFQLLFDDQIWEHLLTETNKYAEATDAGIKMTKEEISTYLAVVLAMGISPESELRDYWSTENPWVGNEGIARTCSRQQFEAWNSIFHFDLDWLITRCVVNAKAHWKPCRKMAIDEWLQAWKGTWKHRQYIKGKPHQNGLKWYLLVDILTYVYDFWLYKGNIKYMKS